MTSGARLTYPPSSGGGGGTPASPDASVQFNNSGSFGGSAALTWLNSLNFLSINNTGLSAFTQYGLSIGSATFGEAPLIQLYTPTSHQAQVLRYRDSVGPDFALRWRDDGKFAIHSYDSSNDPIVITGSSGLLTFNALVTIDTTGQTIWTWPDGFTTIFYGSGTSPNMLFECANGADNTIILRDQAQDNTLAIRMRSDTDNAQIRFSNSGRDIYFFLLSTSATTDPEFGFYGSAGSYSLTINREQSVTFAKNLIMSEMTAPSAPATNGVTIFARDTGGKTQLCALFNTGAVQPIATEP